MFTVSVKVNGRWIKRYKELLTRATLLRLIETVLLDEGKPIRIVETHRLIKQE